MDLGRGDKRWKFFGESFPSCFVDFVVVELSMVALFSVQVHCEFMSQFCRPTIGLSLPTLRLLHSIITFQE